MSDDSSAWSDPRTHAAIGGLVVGVLGILFGIFRDRWARRESRLDSLGKILQPLVRAAQDLMKANNCRRKCEQLKHSFPDAPAPLIIGIERETRFPSRTPEVVARINSLIKEYGVLIESSEKNFREAEVEYATRLFRFPSSIATQLTELRATVSELGRLVNDGFCDKADLQLATFGKQYKMVSDTGKGWRLADPFEGLLRHFRRQPTSEDARSSEFELTDKEMEGVIELVEKRCTSQAGNAFAVHPPKKLLDDMSILSSNRVIEELKDSVFSIVLQDGESKMLTLPELMAFVFNLITFAARTSELSRMVEAARPDGPRNYTVSVAFSMREIIEPEMVKVLLSKISFSDTPSDG